VELQKEIAARRLDCRAFRVGRDLTESDQVREHNGASDERLRQHFPTIANLLQRRHISCGSPQRSDGTKGYLEGRRLVD
jgi:hypothetical protein